MVSIDDLELLNSLRGGNKAALDSIYTRYFNSLFQYGMRMLQDEDAVHDCMQDLFVNLWVKRNKLPDINNLRNYLISSLRNGINNFRLSEKKHESVQLNGEDHFDLKFTVESELIKKEEHNEKAVKLSVAMNKLTARQKEIIYLRYFEEMDYSEIAGVMDMTIKGTYKLSARALESLRLIMGVDKALVLAMLLSLKN
ncbi:RNA polymerase sigma factor [Pedobacter petrophilus]|uniref:RNA polymerase sigma factor n=1 Tax=Pedobacter petrophilus TaxID=1908241 RepID=UPI0012B103AE|nr:sigma-70 family RNA polymerase sigma factor [Pedobacter petrophilus]